MKPTPLLVIFLTVFLLPFVLNEYKAFSSERTKVLQKRQEIASAQKHIRELQETLDQLETKSDALKKIDKALPDDPQVPEFLTFLQKTAPGSGLLLKAMEFSTEATEEKIDKTSFSLTFYGAYPALREFLKTLEQSERLVQIDSLDFNVEEKDVEKKDIKEKEAAMDINLKVDFFSF